MDDDVLRQLYATPPPEFVAARNELVKGLRKDKRREEATTLAGLRRPGWEDWALNAVAGSDADVVAGFAGAASEVREAQSAAIEGRDGPDIRAALRDLRDRSGDLVRLAEAALAGVGRQAGAGEINSRLSQLATNDVAVAQLLAGILGSGDTAPQDLFGGLQLAEGVTPRKPAKRAAAAKAGPERSAAADADADRQRRKDALAAATRDHRAAIAARTRAAAAVDKAEGAVEQARRAVADAEAELATAHEELAAAATHEEEADAAADAARAALDA